MRTKSEAPPAYAGGFLLSTCGIACETRRSMLPIIECIHPLPHGRGFLRSRQKRRAARGRVIDI